MLTIREKRHALAQVRELFATTGMAGVSTMLPCGLSVGEVCVAITLRCSVDQLCSKRSERKWWLRACVNHRAAAAAGSPAVSLTALFGDGAQRLRQGVNDTTLALCNEFGTMVALFLT